MTNMDRFRSFAERYVIERAASFRAGHEEEDGYAATLQARTIYNNIETQSKSPAVCDNRPDPWANQAGSAQVGSSTHHPGVTSAGPPAHSGATGPVQRLPSRMPQLTPIPQKWLDKLMQKERKLNGTP